ncbi:DUF123 domain-containing protein [Thermoproteota archaeon]
MSLKGTYCLCINNKSDKILKIGALGEIFFPVGNYIYVGSALNSLVPRLKRHQKTSNGTHHITHWHIDYFLHEKDVEIQSIYVIENDDHLECDIVSQVSSYGGPVPRFGCSDCKCSSHLYKVNEFNFIEKIGLKKWV